MTLANNARNYWWQGDQAEGRLATDTRVNAKVTGQGAIAQKLLYPNHVFILLLYYG